MSESQEMKLLVAKRLKAAREQAGLSQGQVARMLNIHKPTISEIEAGRRNVTSEETVKFADIYDVNASWLIDKEAEEQDPKVLMEARQLSKLREEDLNSVIKLLNSLKDKSPETT